jgi:hypothetical protein
MNEIANYRAWVVFSGQTDVPWLRLLRRGFRHCFVVLHDGTHWMTVDPMLHHMDVHVHQHVAPDFDLPRWFASRGSCVVPAKLDRRRTRPAPWRPFTCVEAVKRILGVHDRFIATPWQLYRHLAAPHHKRQKKEILAWEA